MLEFRMLQNQASKSFFPHQQSNSYAQETALDIHMLGNIPLACCSRNDQAHLVLKASCLGYINSCHIGIKSRKQQGCDGVNRIQVLAPTQATSVAILKCTFQRVLLGDFTGSEGLDKTVTFQDNTQKWPKVTKYTVSRWLITLASAHIVNFVCVCHKCAVSKKIYPNITKRVLMKIWLVQLKSILHFMTTPHGSQNGSKSIHQFLPSNLPSPLVKSFGGPHLSRIPRSRYLAWKTIQFGKVENRWRKIREICGPGEYLWWFETPSGHWGGDLQGLFHRVNARRVLPFVLWIPSSHTGKEDKRHDIARLDPIYTLEDRMVLLRNR